MPGTRRGGKAGAATSDGKSQAAEENSAGRSADIEVIVQDTDMEDSYLKDLQDTAVLRLRAGVTASRKLIDNVSLEIGDQVDIIKVAKGKEDTPQEVVTQYTQVLEDLLVKGDTLLANFTTKNSSLLEKMEYLLLKLEFSDPEQHAKVESLRNKGEALPYQGRFRKLRKNEKIPQGKSLPVKSVQKRHARFKCTYICKHCSRKGHRAEACWTKFPAKAPGYVAPVKPREPTPGLQKKKRGRRFKSQTEGLPMMLVKANQSPQTPGTGEGIAAVEAK